MALFEYQAHELSATHGAAVLPGAVARDQDEARTLVERIGGPVVVKALVKAGGHGKTGGVEPD